MSVYTTQRTSQTQHPIDEDMETWRFLTNKGLVLTCVWPNNTTNQQHDVIVFSRGAVHYAIASDYVETIEPLGTYQPIPFTQPGLIGVVKIQNHVVSVFDIHVLLTRTRQRDLSPHTCVLVIKLRDTHVGLLADTSIENLRKQIGNHSSTWLHKNNPPFKGRSEDMMQEALQLENVALRERIAELEHMLATRTAEVRTFQALVEHTTDCIGVTDLDGTLRYTNHAFRVHSGSNGHAIGTSIANFVVPAERERIPDIMRDVIVRGEWHGVMTYQFPDGDTFRGLETNFSICNEDGKPQAVGHIVHPIKERQHNTQSESFPSQNATFLQDVIDNIPSAIFIKDTEGRVILANHKIEAIFGFEPGEMLGKTAVDIVGNERFAADVWETERQTLITGISTKREEDIPLEDGIHTHITVKFPVHDAKGNAYAVGGILTDITERKRMEQYIRDGEEHFRLVADFTFDWEYWRGTDGQFIYMSPSCERITGYNKQEFLENANLFISIVHPDDRAMVEEHIQNTQATDETCTFDFRIMTKGGEVRWIGHACQPVFDATGTWRGTRASNRDTTDIRAMEEEQMDLQKQIIEAQREALRELSTPLMPLSDKVLAMPLVGTIDSTRALQVMEALLEGVAQHQVEYVILDITGLPMVDTQVANALIHAARAVRLLGTRVILTGIRPDVAQTLVHLGTDLSEIVTLSTLQQGIAYAMKR